MAKRKNEGSTNGLRALVLLMGGFGLFAALFGEESGLILALVAAIVYALAELTAIRSRLDRD